MKHNKRFEIRPAQEQTLTMQCRSFTDDRRVTNNSRSDSTKTTHREPNSHSGAGENNTPFDFVVFFVFIAPRAPQFQCCFVVGGAVAKRSVYFEAFVPQQRTINIEIGGSGVADERKRTQDKGVLFSPAPDSFLNIIILIATESIAPS